MVIKDIKVVTKGDIVKVSASCKIRKWGWDEVYFTVKKKYKDFIYPDASAFAATLLIPCMKQGEDLIIKGSISEKLYKGIQEVMPSMTTLGLGLKQITIKVDKLTKDKQNANAVGVFFSGGVDSFHTYLRNKNNRGEHISHFILVNGFDIDLRNKKLWNVTRQHVQKIADKEQIELIEVESNLLRLIEPIMTWDYSFIDGIAAVTLLLRNKLKKAYRSSSFKDEPPFGVLNMGFDKYLSTEKLSLVMDGGDVTRIEKVMMIADHTIALDNLRVCYMNKKDTYNCGNCDKCLRTMIGLIAAGKLQQTKTFPNKINLEQIKALQISNEFRAIYHKENLDQLRTLKIEPELQKVIRRILKKPYPKQPYFSGTIMNKIIYLDHIYNKGTVFNTISGMKKKF